MGLYGASSDEGRCTMSASRYVHLEDVSIKRETDTAFLVVIADEEYWIPKSQVADADDYGEGDDGLTLSVTEWICEQKGIET